MNLVEKDFLEESPTELGGHDTASLADRQNEDDEKLTFDLNRSLDLSDETFERLEQLCEATENEREALQVEPSQTASVKLKRVTWENDVKDGISNENHLCEENRLNEEKDFERDKNPNLANESTFKGSGGYISSRLKATSASWDIEVSAFSSSRKPTKRAEALKNARIQRQEEVYIPPRVLSSASQIAQRKVLDLKRWFV